MGRPMHPLEALDEYRRRIALEPNKPDLQVRMGRVMRTILRYVDALEAHRRAYELDPHNPEIVLERALMEHDLGDREIARELYQKVVDMEAEKGASVFQMQKSFTVEAIQGLHALKTGESSPWEGVMMTMDGDPAEHPSKKAFASRRGGIASQGKKSKRRRRRKKK